MRLPIGILWVVLTSLGGAVEIDSPTDGGFRVQALLPLAGELK